MRKALAFVETVVALIAGIIVARYAYFQGFVYPAEISMERIASTFGGFAVGISLAGGIGLGIESLRWRGRGGVWGVGRWIWSLSAMPIALLLIKQSIDILLFRAQ